MKLFKKLLVLLLVAFTLVACGNSKQSEQPAKTGDDTKASKIEKLRIAFVPSRDAKDIATQTEPIKGLLIEELKKAGYEVGAVEINTLTTYEAAGEALVAGSAEIAFLPGGTYAKYSVAQPGAIKVILASVRNGLTYDSENPKDYNTGKPNENTKDSVTYYRGIIVAGPSEIGKKLSAKVNAGEKLAWDDIKDATWCLQSPTSGSGYQYPVLWFKENFGKTFNDVKSVKANGYGGAIKSLQTGQCDIAPGFNDIRFAVKETTDKQKSTPDQWVADGGKNIWEETQVIGVTDKIQNDTISVSSKLVDEKLAQALADAFINLAKTDSGKEAIKIYNHTGYQVVTDADYEGARKVDKLVTELNLNKK